MRLKYPEFRWVVLGCAIATGATAYQCQNPKNPEMQRVQISLPPQVKQEVPAPTPTKRGLCKLYNHQATACEKLYD